MIRKMLALVPVFVLACSATTAPEPAPAQVAQAAIYALPTGGLACIQTILCSCSTSGACFDECDSTWCQGGEPSTACKLCLVDSVAGCGVSFQGCTNPPVDPPPTCCGSAPVCTGNEVPSLCEEEEHFGDCGASDCMSCCNPTTCAWSAYCAP